VAAQGPPGTLSDKPVTADRVSAGTRFRGNARGA
jgi:hypothetical protein